jgi:hypothetical protein
MGGGQGLRRKVRKHEKLRALGGNENGGCRDGKFDASMLMQGHLLFGT